MSAPRSGPGRAVPGDRRAGVQELAALEAQHLGGRRDVDQARPGRRASAASARSLAARRRGSAATVARSASVPAIGGRQSTRLTVDGLGLDGVGEQVGADADDVARGCWSSRPSERARPRAGWPRRWTGGPRRRPRRAPRPGGRGPAGRGRCRRRRPRRAVERPRSPGASRAAGSGSAPWPRTTSSRTTPVRGSAADPAQVLEPQRRVDHRVRAAGVRASSPKSTIVCPSAVRSGPEGQVRGERDVAADRAERRGGDEHRLVAQGAADEEPAQRRPPRPPARRPTPVDRPGRARSRARGGAAPPRRRRSGRAGRAPRSASSTGVRQRRGVLRERGGDLVGRAAWRRARPARRRGRRRAGAAPRGWTAPPTSADRSRPPTPRAWPTPTPAWSSSASSCWQPVPEAATMPTGPGEAALAKPSPSAADDGGAAVGPHHQQAALGGGPLEGDLLLDRHVVAEDHHVAAGVEGVHRLDERAGAGHRDQHERVAGARRRAAAVVRGGATSAAPAVRRVEARSASSTRGQGGRQVAVRRSSRTATTMSLGVASAGHREAHRREHLDVERGRHRDLGGGDARATSCTVRLTWSSVDRVGVRAGPQLDVGGGRGLMRRSPPCAVGRGPGRPGQEAGARSCRRRRAAPAARLAAAGVPSAARKPPSSGSTSPWTAQSSRVAESRVVRWATASAAASTSGVATPAARCMASQPASTSSPSGVRPSPRPTRRATAAGSMPSGATKRRTRPPRPGGWPQA